MANTNAPFGFMQAFGSAGGAPTFSTSVRRIASTNSTAIYQGDPVMPVVSTANGYITQAAAGTTALAGVFTGCQYISVSQKRTVWSNYWPGSDVAATQTVEGYIVNDPNARFVAMVGGSSSTGLTVAAINANVQFAYGTGNTANGLSGAYVVYNSADTTSTLPFRVISLLTDPPGSAGTESGAYNRVIVGFNNVTTKSLTGI
jgi:hypothetical protein